MHITQHAALASLESDVETQTAPASGGGFIGLLKPLKSIIFVFFDMNKNGLMVVTDSYSIISAHTHTQIKTPNSYQNIFYSGLEFHWSDLNDDRWTWCKLQRKKKTKQNVSPSQRHCRVAMTAEAKAGSATLAAFTQTNCGTDQTMAWTHHHGLGLCEIFVWTHDSIHWNTSDTGKEKNNKNHGTQDSK